MHSNAARMQPTVSEHMVSGWRAIHMQKKNIYILLSIMFYTAHTAAHAQQSRFTHSAQRFAEKGWFSENDFCRSKQQQKNGLLCAWI